MEDVSVLKSTGIISYENHQTNVNVGKVSHRRPGFDPAIATLIAEGGVNFFRYLKSLNLSKESGMLVLPSNHHYYYDGKELKNVRILINLKRLNLVKHLDMFLNTLVRILPPNTNFIGCFADDKPLKGNSFYFYHPSRLFGRLINFLDSRTDYIMNKNEVTALLERNGFKTINMKEMNGLTYFYCKTFGNIFN
jgi:hypothetical protein